MRVRRAVDMANYTRVPTPLEVACLINNGYERAVIGCSYGNFAAGQLAACVAGGMDVEAYAWVTFASDWRPPLDRALTILAPHPVKRLWLDCEGATAGLTPGDVVARINAAIGYVRQRAALEIGIYTGGWWWRPNTGDSTAFRDLPLWTAEYVDAPENRQPTLYGGWTSAALWQYAGTVQTCGLNTDRNLILEDDMTEADKAEIVKRINDHTTMKLIALIGWMKKNLAPKP